MSPPGKVWVSTTSHRSRERLRRAVGDPGPAFKSWPKGGHPRGDYYEVPDMPAIRRIPGVRVLRSAPPDLFRAWTSADMGGPVRGHWPAPAADRPGAR
jgi:hypothetical protein